MDTTGRALRVYWENMAETGDTNRNTAASYRAVVRKVLSAIDGGDRVDVRHLDRETALKQFREKFGHKYQPQSLAAYDQRFGQAIDKFLEDLGTEPGKATELPQNRRSPEAESGNIQYPFPLEGGRMATLSLPRDLKLTEVRRLSAFMDAVALDFEPGSK